MKKILYVNSFTVKNADFSSSDAIGYGITSSDALYTALQRNFELLPVPLSFDQRLGELEELLLIKQEVLA